MVGGQGAPAASLNVARIYTQGELTVDVVDVVNGGGYRVQDAAGSATVDAGGVVCCDGDESVVGAVAEAIAGRLTGHFHLHAGALDDGQSLWLVAGDSGRGKTTTTLALRGPGVRLATDDVVYLRWRGGVVEAQARPRPLHVGLVTRELFPELQATDAPQTRAGKAVMALVQKAPASSAWQAVAGLIFPEIDTEGRSRAAPLTTSFDRLLVASAMVTWRGLPNGQAHLDALGWLSQRPALAVVLGVDARADSTPITAAVGAAWPDSPWGRHEG